MSTINTNSATLSSYQHSLAEKTFQLLKSFEEITMKAGYFFNFYHPLNLSDEFIPIKGKYKQYIHGIHSTVKEIQSSVENILSVFFTSRSGIQNEISENR